MNSGITDSVVVFAQREFTSNTCCNKWPLLQLYCESCSTFYSVISNNLNIRKHIWITLSKMTFCTFKGSAVTVNK